MKLSLLFLTKIKIIIYQPMNKYFNTLTTVFIFFLCTCCTKQQAETNNTIKSSREIDSIYILATDLYTYTATNIGRNDFMSYYSQCADRYFDILKDDSTKEYLFVILKNMEIAPINNMQTNDYQQFMYRPIHTNDGRVYWINTDFLNVRALLVLFTNGKCFPIWVSATCTAIGEECYYTPEKLRSYIQDKIQFISNK